MANSLFGDLFLKVYTHNPELLCNPAIWHIFIWPAESDVATISQGVDTFVIRDDRIRLQTMWFTATPK